MGDLKVTFSDAELASIRQAAEGSGLSVEEFVRKASLHLTPLLGLGPVPPGRGSLARSTRAGQKKAKGSPSTAMLRRIRDA